MTHHGSIVAALSILVPLAAQAQQEQWQVALGLQQRGLHEEAVSYFERFLREQPAHTLVPECRYRLAISRIELGAREAAVADLRAALKGGDSFKLRAECRYRLGNLLEASGDHRGACEQFAALAKEVGKDHYLLAAARYAEGEAWRELGDDGKAAAAFAAAADAAPNEAGKGEQATFRFPALYQLGFAQMRGNDAAAAASTFGKAAEAAPDQAGKGECLYLRGDQLLRGGDHAGAARAFRDARRVPGDFADDAALGLGFVALARGDQAAAQKFFAAMIEDFPQSPLAGKARLEIGRSLYGEGKHADAQRTLQPLADGGADADVAQQARELLGLCALATGAGEDAVATLRKALADAPAADKARLSFALGEALANLAHWEDALAAYERVPADAPAELRGEALYGACFALHSLGRHEDSIARAEAVRRIAPPHRLRAQASFAIAENRYAQQRYEDAEREYRAVARDEDFRDRATWKCAWCRYLLGDKQQAAAAFAAIADTKESPFAEEALLMQSLALLDAGASEEALAAADRYRARHPQGRFLDRTERVAARALRQKGDLAGAQKRLERAAKAAAASGAAADAKADRIERAELAYQQGDFRGADSLFAELVAEEDATGARAAAGRAWCAFELGDDEGCSAAIAAAEQHPAAAGELAGVLELKSALAHRQQQWPTAIAAAKTFLEKFPSHGKVPSMRYALGVAQARGGDPKAARETLQELQKDGGHERTDRVSYELAWACRRAGDEPAALAAFAQVAQQSADAELAGEARLHLGVAALDTKGPDAARALLSAVQGAHRGRALYRLGFAEFEAAGSDPKKLAAARDLFAEVAAMPGESLRGEATYLGAECCHRAGDERGAVERLRRLLAEEPQHARADAARLLLGECCVSLGDGAVATPALEQFLRNQKDGPDAVRAHLFLGRARMQRSEHDQAEASLRRVTELTEGPLAAEAQFRIGECRAQRGDLAAAADAFVKLPILYGHVEWVRRGLLQAALTYEKLQQTEKAQRLFRELVQQHKDSDEAKTALTHLRDG